ncbi:TetR/AcrR family transcriptional regulator [Paenarthrobacter nitroguajacolicus]|uniref:TetR/AcrR family transcriptional regulator n=1 Tax=Paenarthrobacter nitroguajacolicus TaxID=211146 RepID=UPI00285FB7B4|nr:TetR/AcrR family transcriptional regulator [Paenarthrobacter nitroguajacolicus]MDR6639472.1 AcrR family transcriptional regulator [Paenarthrobacter nitroguajacolicus]
MTLPDTRSREPKQARSRQSFEKTIEAALALLQERGSDEFTLADVSARSGVSIGSIYARFQGKDELIRVAHGRKMDDIDAVSNHLFASLSISPGAGLELVVRAAVDWTIEVLRRYADILRPFMLRATQDETISNRGAASHAVLARNFSAVLNQWPEGFLHETDVDWSFNVVYSVVARRLGLGSTMEGSGNFDWQEIAEKLAGMVASYLLAGQQAATRP